MRVGNVSVTIELNDSITAQSIAKRLPLEASVSRWGDEIFFPAPVEAREGSTTTDVNIGDIGFFHPGKLLCVFFGRTPASVIDKPVPEGPVEIIGKAKAPLDGLRAVNAGEKVTVSREEQKPAAPVPPPAAPKPSFATTAFGERKLSQTEIDELVKQLLDDKKRAQGGT